MLLIQLDTMEYAALTHKSSDGRWTVDVEGVQHAVEVLGHVGPDTYEVRINGKRSIIEMKDGSVSIKGGTERRIAFDHAADIALDQLAKQTPQLPPIQHQKSPITGIILELCVKEGEKVSKGQPLLILEAMKMENTLTSPRDAIIEAIRIAPGDVVMADQIMIDFRDENQDPKMGA